MHMPLKWLHDNAQVDVKFDIAKTPVQCIYSDLVILV